MRNARKEQKKIISRRADALLSEAQQLNFTFAEVLDILKTRQAALISLERDPTESSLAPLRQSIDGESDPGLLSQKIRLDVHQIARRDGHQKPDFPVGSQGFHFLDRFLL